ncbi:MAG: response regulator [Bacteroidota bacterium]
MRYITRPSSIGKSVGFCAACLLFLFILLNHSCKDTPKLHEENHDIYFNAVFKHAENYRDESIEYVDSVYNAFDEVGVKDLYRKYYFLSYAYSEGRKDYATGMKYADSVIWLMEEHATTQEYVSLYARSYFIKGDVFLAQKKYEDAFQNYYKGRSVIENNADSCAVTEFTNRMAIVIYRQKNYEKAIQYFKKSIIGHSFCSDINQRYRNQQRNLNNIGLCFNKLGQQDSALYYFNRGIQLIENHRSYFPGDDFIETALAVIYGNMGDVYYERGSIDSAEQLYSKSIRINVKRNHENRDAQLTQIKLAKLYLETNRLDKTDQLLNGVRHSLDTLKNEAAELKWWPLQKRYYDTTHQIAKAYILFQDYVKYRDSINTNVQLSHFDINKEFETIKQQYEYDILKKENDVKNFYLIIAVLFAFMTLIILMMAWYNRKLSMKNERELIAAKNIAEQAAIVKQQFLSNMSHEIRTPMNAVVGMTHLLLKENPKPEQQQNLRALQFASENLMALLNDVLDYSKIDAGKIVLEEIDFNIKALINSVKSVHEVSAVVKNIGLSIDLDPQIPEILKGDPFRLTQILNNLLSNAIKFTMEGWVNISIQLEKIDERDFTIHFKVTDTGIGIDNNQQEAIFESFTQASSETTRHFGGTGLGLAITQKLLDLHGSHIILKSEKGKGSIFAFSITFTQSEQQQLDIFLSTDSVIPELNDLSEYRVLIVDDNYMNIVVVEKVVNRWGLHTETATSGKAALTKLREQQFDLILMDLQMPIMSGYETCAFIRSDPAYRHLNVPIIALTADVMSETRERAILHGMNDYISKPFNPEELHIKLLYYLKQSN